MTLLVLMWFACRFEASTKVDDSDSDPGAGEDGGSGDGGEDGGSGGSGGSGEDGGGEGGDDSEAPPDPEDTDDDGDGFSENDGDCDDADVTIYPDAEDGCNAVDDNCDGEVDEDAASDDENEPNDDDDTELGTLGTDDVISVTGALHNDDDVDRFAFDFTDDWYSTFTLTVRLSGIPDDADYQLTLDYLTGDAQRGQTSGGDTLSIELEDDFGYEDGGDYRITVESQGGADCERRYLLSVDLE